MHDLCHFSLKDVTTQLRSNVLISEKDFKNHSFFLIMNTLIQEKGGAKVVQDPGYKTIHVSASWALANLTDILVQAKSEFQRTGIRLSAKEVRKTHAWSAFVQLIHLL